MADHGSRLGCCAIRTVVVALFILANGDPVSRASRGAEGQPTASAAQARNVILVTLDGVRPQEIFGGLDLDVLRSTIGRGTKVEDTRAYERYWAATPEARRERLMPFFWGTLMTEHGSIAGNRARGSIVRVTCRYDNSQAKQPVIGGQRLLPRYVLWGEGTTDEMCLGVLQASVTPQR